MPEPPATERRHSTRTLHGEEIDDPYAWLGEDGDAVTDWIDAHVSARAVPDRCGRHARSPGPRPQVRGPPAR